MGNIGQWDEWKEGGSLGSEENDNYMSLYSLVCHVCYHSLRPLCNDQNIKFSTQLTTLYFLQLRLSPIKPALQL